MNGPEKLQQELDELRARLKELERGIKGDELLRSIATNFPGNIMLLDLDGRIQYLNHTVPGTSPEQLKGLLLTDIVQEEYRPGIRNALQRVIATGAADRYETSYTSPSGDYSWWDSKVAPVSQQGQVTGFVVVSTNVTLERRKTEEQERFFNLSIDLMCVVGFDGYFKRVNHAFLETIGIGDEILKRPFVDFLHPDDVESSAALFARMAEGEICKDFYNRYRIADGSYRLFSWQGVADLNLKLVYGVARDITDTRRMEEKLHQAQRMQAIGQLAGGIAHDFNNLLTAIQGNVDLAREAPQDSGDALDNADVAIARAAALTQQLLLFSQNRTSAPVAVNLNQILDNSMKLLKRLLPENIAIHLQHAVAAPAVMADPTQLEQVILNLCVNARDAMPQGGRLSLTLQETTIDNPREAGLAKGPYLTLTVEDTGCGMPKSVQDRIFEPFFTTKGPGRGTGLGLATVYAIVRHHEGFIDVRSEPGRGSCFRVYLPLHEGTVPAPAAGRVLRASISGGSETILLAEDEPTVREVATHILRKAGYKVFEACDGVEAVALYKQHRDNIDLALLDVVMPNRSGLETAQLLRAVNANLKIVFASGHVQNSEDVEKLRNEVFMHKPYRRDELLSMVRETLDRTAGSESKGSE